MTHRKGANFENVMHNETAIQRLQNQAHQLLYTLITAAILLESIMIWIQ